MKSAPQATQKQHNEMYAQLRLRTKRIVLASTSKMGTGANIQTKPAALHNLDIPWKLSYFDLSLNTFPSLSNTYCSSTNVFVYFT